MSAVEQWWVYDLYSINILHYVSETFVLCFANVELCFGRFALRFANTELCFHILCCVSIIPYCVSMALCCTSIIQCWVQIILCCVWKSVFCISDIVYNVCRYGPR